MGRYGELSMATRCRHRVIQLRRPQGVTRPQLLYRPSHQPRLRVPSNHREGFGPGRWGCRTAFHEVPQLRLDGDPSFPYVLPLCFHCE